MEQRDIHPLFWFWFEEKHKTFMILKKNWSLLNALPLISGIDISLLRVLQTLCVYSCVNSLILSVKDDHSQFSGIYIFFIIIRMHTRLYKLTVQVQKMNIIKKKFPFAFLRFWKWILLTPFKKWEKLIVFYCNRRHGPF